jgi:hypothetical protein
MFAYICLYDICVVLLLCVWFDVEQYLNAGYKVVLCLEFVGKVALIQVHCFKRV